MEPRLEEMLYSQIEHRARGSLSSITRFVSVPLERDGYEEEKTLRSESLGAACLASSQHSIEAGNKVVDLTEAWLPKED